jgi:hypothetical protein
VLPINRRSQDQIKIKAGPLPDSTGEVSRAIPERPRALTREANPALRSMPRPLTRSGTADSIKPRHVAALLAIAVPVLDYVAHSQLDVVELLEPRIPNFRADPSALSRGVARGMWSRSEVVSVKMGRIRSVQLGQIAGAVEFRFADNIPAIKVPCRNAVLLARVDVAPLFP